MLHVEVSHCTEVAKKGRVELQNCRGWGGALLKKRAQEQALMEVFKPK